MPRDLVPFERRGAVSVVGIFGLRFLKLESFAQLPSPRRTCTPAVPFNATYNFSPICGNVVKRVNKSLYGIIEDNL